MPDNNGDTLRKADSVPKPGKPNGNYSAEQEYFVESTNQARPLLRPVILRPIHELVAEQREAQWLIHRVLEKNVLAILAGPRSSFKSFIALHWSMEMAVAGHPGVLLSAEGGGLDRRIAAWMNQHRESTDLSTVPIVALERPLNLNSIVELELLREAIEALTTPPEFIVIDTLSKFAAGLDENDNSKVAEFLSSLSVTLREELRCTVLLVAHSGHGDAKRPRGASSLMSNPDAEYMVERPDAGAMTVTVSRERFKDAASLPPLAYAVKVIDLGRFDQYGDPVTSLALVPADAPLTLVKGRGRNQEKVLVALREWHRAHPQSTHITSIDMREICKAQNINRKRQREVIDGFVANLILTHAPGGWVFHEENL
jgi:hypothetical protein